VTGEDLIESVSRPKPAWRLQVDKVIRGPRAVGVLLVCGLVVGALSGYLVGHNNPRVLDGISVPSPGLEAFVEFQQGAPDVDAYGPPPMTTLTTEDVAALGENVTRQVTVLMGRSVIPTLCRTSVGQPGYNNVAGPAYSSIAFNVDGGRITQLVWPRTDEVQATATLQTLDLQARLCPTVADSSVTMVTDGVQTGIGDEYAVFHTRPTSSEPSALFATAVLVRVGSDLIEVSFTSASESPSAEARCLAAAAAAVRVATGG